MTEGKKISPNWGATTKLVVGLTFVAIAAALLIRFQSLLGPLLLVFILTYLLFPLVNWLHQKAKLSWSAATNLIFLAVLVIVSGAFVVLGLAIFQQLDNLVDVVSRFINDLPELIDRTIERLPTEVGIGPYIFSPTQLFNQIDLESLIQQALGILQPLLGQAGSLIGSLASTTLNILGWGSFVLLAAYFIMAGLSVRPKLSLVGVDVPEGYEEDARRLLRNLGYIWNAFVRGQFVLFLMTIVLSAMLMSALGVRNALALAMLAGGARFVPYVGPFITWAITAMVAFLQSSNYLGLAPFPYAVIVVLAAVILDQIFDNYISPRLLGEALGVHPAAVLVGAIIAANLIGFVGLLLASPVLATALMLGRYALRKMLDLDPWPDGDIKPEGLLARFTLANVAEQARTVGDRMSEQARVMGGKLGFHNDDNDDNDDDDND